ncbi:MAG: High-affinity nickel transporter [Pedosphaera sp.]|nr:High-affinity nickel transporter [Pedosphaera sp.]
MLIIIGGLIAGLIHVLSGPDHLAAIAPLVMKQRQRAWLTGLRWGAGHASGVVVVGILSLLLRGILPVDIISRWSDRLVGALLIGIGLWALRKGLQIHTHAHEHRGEAHEHIHLHGQARKKVELHVHTHAAFGIGTLHGLAGSSHFLAIIPSLAMPSNALAITYLVAYGAGTVLAMMAFASVIGSLTVRFAGAAKVYRGMMFACSAVAIVVGCCWVFGFSF